MNSISLIITEPFKVSVSYWVDNSSLCCSKNDLFISELSNVSVVHSIPLVSFFVSGGSIVIPCFISNIGNLSSFFVSPATGLSVLLIFPKNQSPLSLIFLFCYFQFHWFLLLSWLFLFFYYYFFTSAFFVLVFFLFFLLSLSPYGKTL